MYSLNLPTANLSTFTIKILLKSRVVIMNSLPSGVLPRQNDSPEPETPSAISHTAEPELRIQPWKQYVAEIARESEEYKKNNSIDTDYFKVSEGFNDHGISG